MYELVNGEEITSYECKEDLATALVDMVLSNTTVSFVSSNGVDGQPTTIICV